MIVPQKTPFEIAADWAAQAPEQLHWLYGSAAAGFWAEMMEAALERATPYDLAERISCFPARRIAAALADVDEESCQQLRQALDAEVGASQ